MEQASLYQSANSVQKHDAEQIIKEYAHRLQWRPNGADRILDVGCGSGNVLMEYVYPILPQNFKQLIGTDVSAKMVSYARKLYAEFERTSFEVLDITTEKLPKHLLEQFDHVTSFYCLHWVQDLKSALQNIYRLLRADGGDCLLVFLADNPIYEVYRIICKNPKWAAYMWDVDKFISPLSNVDNPSGAFSKLLHEVGYVDYNVEIRNRVFVYEGVENVKANIKAICPFVERLPEEQHEEFLNDIVNTVASLKLREENVDATDYRFISSYKLIVAYARKPVGGVPISIIGNERG